MTQDRQKGLKALLRVERMRDTNSAIALACAVADEANASEACEAARGACRKARVALAAYLAPDLGRPLDLTRYDWLSGHHRTAVARLEQADADHEQARRARQAHADARVQTKRRCERLAEQLDRLDNAAAIAAAAHEREEGTETWLAHRGETS